MGWATTENPIMQVSYNINQLRDIHVAALSNAQHPRVQALLWSIA